MASAAGEAGQTGAMHARAPAQTPDHGSKHDSRIIALIGTGHFLSHFYMLCLAPLFLTWHAEFGVSYAALGLSVATMSAITALLQTPVGFWVDRFGARRFLVGGTLLMTLSISAMAFAPNYWVILLLAALSGLGNSVIHPCDYAILAGSVHKSRMGRAFSMHTFTGNLGFAAAPPVIALLVPLIGWRPSLGLVGLLGLPVVAAILWQSRILHDQAKPRTAAVEAEPGLSGRQLLLSRPMLLFFAFMLLSSMAMSGLQNFLIPVLGKLWATPAEAAAWALTGYMAGATSGTLVGGWMADRFHGNRLLRFVVVLTLLSMVLFVTVGVVPLPMPAVVALTFIAGLALGSSRTPRDVMVKDASPPGQIGKVFGFVSAGLPLGGALVPAPMGLLIDLGQAWLVLPIIAGLLGLSLLCAGEGRRSARNVAAAPLPVAAE